MSILLFHRQFPFAFLLTPRAGCTSVSKWFFYQIGHLGKIRNLFPQLPLSSSVHKYRARYHKEYHDKSVSKIKGSKKIVKVLRDPFKRAVSSYLIANQLKSSGREYSNLSFKSFLEKIILRMDSNTHISPQFNREDRFVDIYIKNEAFKKWITRDKRFKTPSREIWHSGHNFSGSNSDQNNLIFKPEELADVVVTPEVLNKIKTSGYRDYYDWFYNPETIRLVRKAYRIDFVKYKKFYPGK